MVRWVFTEGVHLFWRGVVTIASRGVPMLTGALLNFAFTLFTVIVAALSAAVRVFSTAAWEVISLF